MVLRTGGDCTGLIPMPFNGPVPTEQQVRDDRGLPATAEFKGWVVHTPDQGGFLAVEIETPHACVRKFASPATAKLFPTPEAAGKVVTRLDYPAVVAAVFAVESQLAIIPVGRNAHCTPGT